MRRGKSTAALNKQQPFTEVSQKYIKNIEMPGKP
jgi:hypothetical protein